MKTIIVLLALIALSGCETMKTNEQMIDDMTDAQINQCHDEYIKKTGVVGEMTLYDCIKFAQEYKRKYDAIGYGAGYVAPTRNRDTIIINPVTGQMGAIMDAGAGTVVYQPFGTGFGTLSHPNGF